MYRVPLGVVISPYGIIRKPRIIEICIGRGGFVSPELTSLSCKKCWGQERVGTYSPVSPPIEPLLMSEEEVGGRIVCLLNTFCNKPLGGFRQRSGPCPASFRRSIGLALSLPAAWRTTRQQQPRRGALVHKLSATTTFFCFPSSPYISILLSIPISSSSIP